MLSSIIGRWPQLTHRERLRPTGRSPHIGSPTQKAQPAGHVWLEVGFSELHRSFRGLPVPTPNRFGLSRGRHGMVDDGSREINFPLSQLSNNPFLQLSHIGRAWPTYLLSRRLTREH